MSRSFDYILTQKLGFTSYHYWTLNPDQATSEVTLSQHDPSITAKLITNLNQPSMNYTKEGSICTESVAEASGLGLRGRVADDSVV